jgi:hypothetical protein
MENWRTTSGGKSMLNVAKLRVLLLLAGLVLAYLAGSAGSVSAQSCIPDGGIDDTLYNTDCCSGYAVPGSTWCEDPADYGTTWASCYHICGESSPPSGCLRNNICPE